MCDEDVALTALISAAKGGDRDALNQLLSRYRPDIRNWIQQQCGTEAAARIDVSDVTQEALLYVFRSIQRFRGSAEQELVAWLKRISLHKLVDEVRKNAAQKRNQTNERSLDESRDSRYSLAKTVTYDGSRPSEQIVRRERLERALAQLPADQRAVARLRYVERREPDDIAREMGISPEEVVLRLSRALRGLRNHLRKEQ